MIVKGESIVVGLGEMHVIKKPSAILTCVGLGSCIALCAYDPVSKVGGIAHMVLPNSNDGGNKKKSPRYIDTGVPLLVQEMSKQGAAKSRLVFKAAGGAQMLSIPGLNGRLNIGERNVAELKPTLAKEGISVSAADMGGNSGRTIQLFLDTGKVIVKTVGGRSIEL